MLSKRSFSLAGHRTSVALEPAFWAVLEAAAKHDGVSLASLVTGIDRDRASGHALASALRIYALTQAGRFNLRTLSVVQ